MSSRKKTSTAKIERGLIEDADNDSAWETAIRVPASKSPRPEWYGRSNVVLLEPEAGRAFSQSVRPQIEAGVELEDRLRELGSQADSIFLNPITVTRLRNRGIDIPEPPRLSAKEKVNVLFNDRRREHAIRILEQLPERPDIPVSSIQCLYSEIRSAIALGLYGAAITLCGILVEYALKYVTYKTEIGGFVKYDPTKWDEFESLDLAAAIARAARNRLLTRDAKRTLNDFRARFRNPYNHYNIRKITSNYYHEGLTILNTKDNQVEVRNVAAKDDPIIQAAAKPIADADNVILVYLYADSVVRYLWNKIKDLPPSS